MKYINYFFREIKNLFEFYLIPILVVVLPQKIYYSFFKFICNYTFFYSLYTKDSYYRAAKIIIIKKPQNLWNRNVKLLYLMDFADYWLTLLRPKKVTKMLIKQGKWDETKGFLAVGAHWGNGYLIIHDLKTLGISPIGVFGEAPVAFENQGFIESHFRKIRLKYIHKASGSSSISGNAGGGYELIKKSILNKDVPLTLFDVPKSINDAKYSLDVFNHRYYIPSGVIKLICKDNIPYQVFSVKLDLETGQRILRIKEIQNNNSEERVLAEFSSFFESLIHESPELWYFWQHSEGLFHIKRSNYG